MEILKQINLIAAIPLVVLIWVYQKTLSPDHGPLKVHFPHGYCKFYPTCSMYAREVLQREGLVGLPKIFIRISKCNPFTQPSINKV
jgi:putative membrane protein insertion efficiency factor